MLQTSGSQIFLPVTWP